MRQSHEFPLAIITQEELWRSREEGGSLGLCLERRLEQRHRVTQVGGEGRGKAGGRIPFQLLLLLLLPSLLLVF